MTELFVTGTDTGVGKTVVAAALLAHAAAHGRVVRCFKPAESGCSVAQDGSLSPADAILLRAAAGDAQPLHEVCPHRYQEAVAPGVAAARTGPALDFDLIVDLVQGARSARPDLLLVEGAGGLLVPYGEGVFAADLAARLDLPLLVVARPGLGTINHTLLTLHCAKARGLPVEAVVLCEADGPADRALADSNVREIEKAGGVPVLGLLPHLESLALTALADAAREHLRLQALRL